MWLNRLSAGLQTKGSPFNSQSGRVPGLWARSPVQGTWEATTHLNEKKEKNEKTLFELASLYVNQSVEIYIQSGAKSRFTVVSMQKFLLIFL